MADEIEYVEYDFNPNKLPDDLLRAIGLTAAAAAQTEHVMGQLIGGLLRIDDIDTEALTTEMANPLKEKIIRSLVELKTRHLAEIDEIDELLVICPLLSGPISVLELATKEERNVKEAQARGDHRQAA